MSLLLGRMRTKHDEIAKRLRQLGAWVDPVSCSLRIVHLDDDDLRYEAISYVWGDSTDRKTLLCNGSIVSTTRSLFEALQRFRYVDTTRTLWADVLYINQADTDKRTSQVTSVGGAASPEVAGVAIDALRRICSSTWFGRGWSIQEMVLGTSASVFWGHAEISFEWLGLDSHCVLLDHPDE
ncbi:hypothetical protein G6011_05962 [Alternaria panax]|uniref:Heterokaryon incompatibility domain-containing protein n=1 Tax=Alternaria panax TaxID=48097 RepID=A0AAD4FKL4_9PLEO|nr:hypothetical protein G6011_05962 [Alternaria panax]